MTRRGRVRCAHRQRPPGTPGRLCWTALRCRHEGFRTPLVRGKGQLPRYRAASPRFSLDAQIGCTWPTRSRAGRPPVLIWPHPVATARSRWWCPSVRRSDGSSCTGTRRCGPGLTASRFSGRVRYGSLDQQGIGRPRAMRLQPLRVGHEEVVTDDLDLPAQLGGHQIQPSQSSSDSGSSMETIG